MDASKRRFPGLPHLLLAFSLTALSPGQSQTLDISDGIHTYVALTNTTVNLSGVCELHLTGTNNLLGTHHPLPGSVIHLNSPDAWLFLDNTRPAFVMSTYLAQINVAGAAADINTNIRVAEYGSGSMIIPIGPSFQPLQVFAGAQFSGSSASVATHTFHTAASNNIPLGGNIGSFILKRGYMATIGRQADSRFGHCYVAQDGDLHVGALPAVAHGNVGFIRVLPWSAPGKKGWAGGADPNGSLKVDPLWNYDWNNGATSTADVEYSPIRQNAGWPSFAVTYDKRGSTHYLGFNEPDSSSQANMSVDRALAQWPNLMQSGLRLVSPAPTDGGKGWLYHFMDRIRTNGLGLRVDAAAIHMYQCGHSASSLQSWLLDVHNRTRRKVWLTEFNNGANWTTCADPTFDQNAAAIQGFISMMDTAPFMERYSIYQWVETVRMMVTNDASGAGVLTPAGTNYLKQHSPRAYVQEYPAGAGPDAMYHFDGDALDSTGSGNNGLVAGAPVSVAGQSGSGYAVHLDGIHDYVQLPAGVGIAPSFTFAAWVKWNGGNNWQRIFDNGLSTSAYMFLTPRSGSGTLRFAIKTTSSSEQRLETTGLSPGVWTHVAVTLNGTTGKLFVNGAVAASGSITINPTQIDATFSYLGRSQFSADPLFAGELDSVLFAGYALTDTQVAGLMAATPVPPQFTSDPVIKPAATLFQAYSASLAGDAGSPGLTFSKVDGPGWLAIAPDGTLSGVPGVQDVGRNLFHVRAVDAAGACAVSRLTIPVNAAPQQIARYGFDGNVDATGGTNLSATLAGTASFGSGVENSAIVLDGTANFLTLPRGIAHSSNITVAAWVNWTGGNRWERIFDFGNGEGQYLFLTPRSGSDTLRFAIKNTSVEQVVETTQLPMGQWTHLAITLDGSIGRLYVNGSLAASAGMTITPATIEPLLNYVGKSQWPDPLFKGSIDTFAVYNYALSSAEIATLAGTQPPAAPNGVNAIAASSSRIDLTWTASSGASSYNVKRAGVSGGPYTTLASGITSTTHSDTGLSPSTTYYYVVSAVNTQGESANSAEAGATTDAGAVPNAPGNLSATAAKRKVTISWSDNSTDETGFRIERSTDGVNFSEITTVSANTASYQNTGLSSGTTYHYRVRAYNANGTSSYSNVASATAR